MGKANLGLVGPGVQAELVAHVEEGELGLALLHRHARCLRGLRDARLPLRAQLPGHRLQQLRRDTGAVGCAPAADTRTRAGH